MKYALGIMFIFLLPIMALSEQMIISLESAVKTSDIIVIGTLRDVSEETKGGMDYGTGEIIIDEVLWGNVEQSQQLNLVWQNESNVDCPRNEHRNNQNKQGIWLLTKKPVDKVVADNPGRFVKVEKREKVLELVREQEKFNK